MGYAKAIRSGDQGRGELVNKQSFSFGARYHKPAYSTGLMGSVHTQVTEHLSISNLPETITQNICHFQS